MCTLFQLPRLFYFFLLGAGSLRLLGAFKRVGALCLCAITLRENRSNEKEKQRLETGSDGFKYGIPTESFSLFNNTCSTNCCISARLMACALVVLVLSLVRAVTSEISLAGEAVCCCQAPEIKPQEKVMTSKAYFLGYGVFQLEYPKMALFCSSRSTGHWGVPAFYL